MEEEYNQALQKIKETKSTSIKEWNELAMRENLLSTESLKYISGSNWHNLRNTILAEL